MLSININDTDFWDEEHQEFITVKGITLNLEHSLISISKWESKHHKPYLNTEKTNEEILDYIKCMTLNQNVDPNVYFALTKEDILKIKEYIENPMTATTFYEPPSSGKSRHTKDIVTSELIYYAMTVNNIPQEYQKWHINRLLTLIKVCNIKNEPPKKMSKSDIYKQNASLNAARKKRLHTKG